MGTFKAPRLGFALTLLILSSYSYASHIGHCRTGCRGPPQHTKYVEGTTYKYNLEGNIDIAVHTAEGQLSSTKLKATVLVTQLPECNQLLRIQNVQVIGPDGKKHSNIDGINKPIRINTQDGHIEDSICADADDTQNSLNIKRAVASLFQADIKQRYETDVFGVCPTEISTRKEGSNFIIHKTRHLNKCSHRENIKQDFMATSFDFNSEIKSSPILNSEYKSEQIAKNGILDRATVTENYLYVPFSVGQNGAKATVTTKLSFAGSSKESPQNFNGIPKSIIFENPHLITTGESNVDAILKVLKETIHTVELTVGEKSAKSFVNLIRVLRNSKKDDILSVYGQVKAGAGFKDKVEAKQIFLDAVFRTGTGETVEVGIELLKNKELDPIEQKLVYLGLIFVKHATASSVVAATHLLDLPNIPREAYLGVGVLAGRFCRQHSCDDVDAINKLTHKLLSKLGDGKPKNKEDENRDINILKALANMETLNEAAAAKVIAIAQDKKVPNRLRVVALETYLADACYDKIRDSAVNILKDIQQDSEIRIKAYLAAAQCPNGKVANAIKALLDKEPSYQVGGFIVSHINNLRASANPDKQLAKQHLGQISTTKKFPIDFRKFSNNRAYSHYVDSLGYAYNMESNIIYSQNSFAARSADLNLTAQVFGHTVNFLEVGLRQENLDKVLEHYFGPLGVLREASHDDLVKHGKDSLGKLYKHFSERLAKSRGKRDVSKADIDNIGKHVQIKTNELNKDLDLDLSVKLFGSELLFLSICDHSDNFSPESIIDHIFDNLDKRIAKAKDFERSIQTNLLFLDSEISYPTSLGFPLRLTVEGSSSLKLKTAGKIDIPAILEGNFEKSPLKLSLIPSANIEISGRLTIDAQVVENGLKVTSTLHTATGGDLEVVVLKGGKGIDIKFGLPVQHQQLISATSEVVYITRELGNSEIDHPIKFGQNKDFSVCVDQLSPFIGLTFCADINSPPERHGVPVFSPFSGNAKFAVRIQKDDLSHIHLKEVVHDEPQKLGVEYVVEVIGANNNQKAALNIEAFASPETFVKASLISPMLAMTAEGRIVNNAQEKSISALFEHAKHKYSAKFGFGVSGNSDKAIYKPLIEYNGPGPQGQQLPVNVEGAIIVEKLSYGRKYTFDNVQIIRSGHKAINVQGNVEMHPAGASTDLTVSCGDHSGSVKGKIESQKDTLIVDAELKNTHNPDFNVHVVYNAKKQPNHFDSNLEITHGQDLTSKVNRLTLNNMIYYKSTSHKDAEGKFKNKLAYPLMKIDGKVNVEFGPKHLDYDLKLQYGAVKVGSELSVKVAQKDRRDYNIELEIYGFDNKVEVKSKREVTGEKSKIGHLVNLNGKKYELSGTIDHHIKRHDVKVGSDLVLKIPSNADPIKLQNGLILNPNEFDAHLKLSCGSHVIVDTIIKATKDNNADGHLKIALKDFLLVNGQLRAMQGSGNAHVLVELPRSNRKVKVESVFTVSEPTYNLVLTVYPDFEKSPNKYILSTENQIKHKFIESKNFIEGPNNKRLEANFKGSSDGCITNGKYVIEFDITSPSGQYGLVKIIHDLRVVSGIGHGIVHAIIERRENKNAPGFKIDFTGTLKSIDTNKHLYDISHDVIVENKQEKLLIIATASKRQFQDDHHVTDASIKASGSLLPHPVEIDGYVKRARNAASYKINGKCGSEVSLGIHGKYNLEDSDRKLTGELSVHLTTPHNAIHVIKFGTGITVVIPQTPEDDAKYFGTLRLFVDDKGAKPDPTVDVDVSVDASGRDDRGQLKSTLKINKCEPVTVDFGYALTSVDESKKLNGHLVIQYEKDQVIRSDLDIVLPHENEIKIDLKLHSPHYPNARLEINAKKSSDDKEFNSELILTHHDKKFIIRNDIISSEVTPLFDLQLVLPNGKEDRILLKANRASPKELGGEFKIIINEANFVLEGSIDAKLANADDFFVKITANAPVLKINNVVLEAVNKPAKGGKRIQITAKAAGKNIVSGSTNYKAREEGGKYIIEGSGSLKVHEESKQSNFKIIRQSFSMDRNGEEGEELLLNVMFGSKAIDAEFKCTNKHFRILTSYCEEKKQCGNVEIYSKTTAMTNDEFNNELEIAVDLRNLGLSHEFGLKSVTNRKHLVFDHSVDIYFHSKPNKYQYSLYVHPSEVGAQLTTPKRVVALEGKVQLPRHDKAKGKAGTQFKGELTFYLDKKAQPDKKTALIGEVDCKDERNCIAEFRLRNPELAKDLTVLYVAKCNDNYKYEELILDIFNKVEDKIMIGTTEAIHADGNTYGVHRTAEIKSEGLNFNIKYEMKTGADTSKSTAEYYEVLECNMVNMRHVTGIISKLTPETSFLSLKLFNKEILTIDSKYQYTKEHLEGDTNIQILGFPHLVSHLELKEPYTLTYYIARKDDLNTKILVTGNIDDGKMAKFHAEYFKGSKYELAHAAVHLDEKNFLKTDYKINNENIKNVLLPSARQHANNFQTELDVIFESAVKEIRAQTENIAKGVATHIPNLRPLQEYYLHELGKFREELVSDKTIQNIEEFLKGIFGAVIYSVSEVVGRVSNLVENIMITLQVHFAESIKIINKEIIPELKVILQKSGKVASQALEKIIDAVFIFTAEVCTFIENHPEEIKYVVDTFGKLGQDVGRFLYRLIHTARAAVKKEYHELYHTIKNLPISEEIKVRYEQIANSIEIPTIVINTIKEAVITLRDAVPSQDMKNLITLVGNYLEKKLKGEPVDDSAEITKIVELADKILENIFSNVNIEDGSKQWKNPFSYTPKHLLTHLPKLGSMKFSPLLYLLSARWPSVAEIVHNLSLHPLDYIPPYKLDAFIVQGQHIFTFDGKHLTFPGNCDYLLARDAVNGNFTIVGTFTNGLLTALTFADKANSATLKQGGQVFLNNAATEFPVHKPHLDIERTYEGVLIHSKAGVRIYCGPDLVVCGIHVSGFYHAQLRGLLGNGNFEPYDDFTLPNGKIVMSEGDFGNSYKMAPNCPPVTTVDHSVHHHDPICNTLFGEDSPLSYCFPFVNPENYKIACTHGLAAGVAGTKEAIVAGYVASCRSRMIPIRVLPEHVGCKNGGSHNVGDTFSVKTPGKAADIVVIVDLAKLNEPVYKELVQPLVAQISNEFNSKGINDVEIHLITYGGENDQHPSHHTVTGKLTFKGKSPNLKFGDAPEHSSTGCENVDDALKVLRILRDEVKLIARRSMQQRSYTEALKYPFRPHAVKTIIGVVGKQCREGLVYGLQRLGSLLFSNEQLSVNYITPIHDFEVRDAKITKGVIGFDADHVFTFADAKKKPEGSPELHDDLQYHDYCIDFTLKNRGNVFVTDNFLHAKGAQRKQFTQVAAHNIVNKLLTVEQELECECKLVTPYSAQNVCEVISSKSKAAPTKKGGHKA